jgi:hypothetical protein
MANQNWTDDSYRALGGLELASIIYIFAIGVFGVFAFMCESLVLLILVNLFL